MLPKSPRALVVLVFASSVWGDRGDLSPDFGECHCHKSSGNKRSCCAAQNHAGMGTGNFCGSHFQHRHCGGENPVCCTSNGESQCCPAGSSCSFGCLGGGAGGKGFGGCGCLPPPQPSEAQTLYNETRARAFAQFAHAAYCGVLKKGLLTWSCPVCEQAGLKMLPNMRLVDRTDEKKPHALFAYVVGLEGDDAACMVGFRGTVDKANWIRNLEAAIQSVFTISEGLDQCDGCVIHKGFAIITRALLYGDDGVVESLKSLGCGPGSGREVFVTGHSMGAAVATLSMGALQALGFRVGRSYVFESPRVGNAAYAKSFMSRFGPVALFRVTHLKDPVIRVPAHSMGWRHVGAEAYYGPSWNNSYVVCQESEDHLCSQRYWFFDDFLSGFMVQDHVESPLLADPAERFGNPSFCHLTV